MNPMKLILLAGAGYLAYSFLNQQGHAATATGTGAGANVPPPSTTTASQNPAAQPAGPATTSAPSSACSMTPVPTDDALMRAAINKDWIGPVGNYCQNAWQWNWWRQQYVARNGGFADRAQQTTFDDITDPRINITAAEYHALLARKGLSGLRWVPTLPYGGWNRLVH